MSFQYLNWATQLKGVSPVGRLLAFWMGNWARLLNVNADLADGLPAWEVEIDPALEWIGCSEFELLHACDELIAHGVDPLNVVGRKIQFTFPDIPDTGLDVRYSTPDRPLSIYVISAADGVTKIGVSRSPATRLAGLQASNPINKLQLVWTIEGRSPAIRRAENKAHAALSEHAIGNEWFRVSSAAAIEIVRQVLSELGVEA